MIIKKFKQFESNQISEFPDLEEIKTYFYDLMDESGHQINLFDIGYKFYLKPHRVGDDYQKILMDKSNFIDVLNTDITDKKLSNISNYASVNEPLRHVENKTALNSIKDGAIAYKHMMINFLIPGDYYSSLFNENEFNILINCLLTLYNHTGFRCYGDYWTEDYVGISYESQLNESKVITKFGFSGLFLNCEDDVYRKIAELGNIYYPGNKNVQKYFL